VPEQVQNRILNLLADASDDNASAEGATHKGVHASAALALRFVLGMWVASAREVAPPTPDTVTLQKIPIETSPESQVVLQRR